MTEVPLRIEDVRALVNAVVEQAPAEVQKPLLAQVGNLKCTGGPVTMIQLSVDDDAAPAHGVDNPVPGGPAVCDANEEAIGGLLLWLDASGYIECLEYWWVTDEMPTELPSPSQVRKS